MILISPAKNLNLEPLEFENHQSSPSFKDKTEKLVSILNKLKNKPKRKTQAEKKEENELEAKKQAIGEKHSELVNNSP